MFEAQKNLKPHEIIALIEQSKHKAVRRITEHKDRRLLVLESRTCYARRRR